MMCDRVICMRAGEVGERMAQRHCGTLQTGMHVWFCDNMANEFSR